MRLDDGFYIVEVEGKRVVAERLGDMWMQTGIDYDIWQYTANGPIPVNVIARINLETLIISQVAP